MADTEASGTTPKAKQGGVLVLRGRVCRRMETFRAARHAISLSTNRTSTSGPFGSTPRKRCNAEDDEYNDVVARHCKGCEASSDGLPDVFDVQIDETVARRPDS